MSVGFPLEKITSISEARSSWRMAPLIKHSRRTSDGSAGVGRLSLVGTDFEGFVLVELCTEWNSASGGSKVVMVQDAGRRGVERERVGSQIVGHRAHTWPTYWRQCRGSSSVRP